MARSRLILNFIVYLLFVFTLWLLSQCITGHACLLKSAWFEAILPILTGALFPLILIVAPSTKALCLRLVLCCVLTVGVNGAYEAWLHSDAFPRQWLDLRAQEWKLKEDQMRAAAFEHATKSSGVVPP